jgi:hypothetical protein
MGKHTTGDPGFKADRAGNLLTALTVARRDGCVAGRARKAVRARHTAGPKTRNIIRHRALLSGPDKGLTGVLRDIKGSEGSMATRQRGQIVETPTEARQAEPGPSVLALLTVSTGLAVLILGVVWFVFFRT